MPGALQAACNTERFWVRSTRVGVGLRTGIRSIRSLIAPCGSDAVSGVATDGENEADLLLARVTDTVSLEESDER
jgi:hypothetical protein